MAQHLTTMHAAFGTVIWVVCGLGVVGAFVALVWNGRTWEEYSKDHLLMERESSPEQKPGSAASQLEREIEIRQLLEARNARRQRRGEAPIDIEAELATLTGSPPGDAVLRADPVLRPDAALRAEVRDLVVARNYRRQRSGKPGLDVEAEVERQLARIDGSAGASPRGESGPQALG